MSPIVRTYREQIRPSDFDRLAAIIADGGIAITPTDTVYGLIGKAFDSKVFERLDTIKGERRLPYSVAFSGVGELDDWYGGIGIRARRLASTLLPGPVTFLLQPNGVTPTEFRHRNAGFGVRVSSDSILPELARRIETPIWATSANRSGDPAPGDFRSISRGLIQSVDIAFDAGPTTYRDASSVVDLRTGLFRIMRAGPWEKRIETALERSLDPLRVVTICSGNTCRSPIAASLLDRELLDLPKRVVVSSAGLDALPDLPASREMVQIGSNWGLDLSEHKAQQASIELFRRTDIILAASPQHRDRIIQIEPRAKWKTFLMAEPLGSDSIPDPYQFGDEQYLLIAEMIRRAMRGWAERIRNIIQNEFDVSRESTMHEPPAVSAPVEPTE